MVTRAAASNRIFEYYSCDKLYSSILVLEYLLLYICLRLQIVISGCSFLLSVDELLEFIETLGFAISFAIASLEIDLNIYMLLQGIDPLLHRYGLR